MQRQRARGTVRVSEPAYGFFIAGSSILAMNGVYSRRNPPRVFKEDDTVPRIALYYEHEDGVWHMALHELPQQGGGFVDDEDEDDDEDTHRYWRPQKKKPTHEWVFLDEFNFPRFCHDGDTIVPGAGTRWKHVHKKAPETCVSETEKTLDNWRELETDGENTPHTTALAEIKPDDNDELPWQVIAILDIDMVQNLLYSSEHRKRKIREAKMGKNAPKPVRGTLAAAFAPGMLLLFR